MKKFLLLIAAIAVGVSANAVELSFKMGGKTITPGQTVIFNDVEITTYDDYKEVTMDPGISIISDMYSSNIKITATCTSGQKIEMCCGGACMGDYTVVKEKLTLHPNQPLPLDFEYRNEDLDLDEEIPTVVTTIEAEDVTEEGSKVQFVIEMGEKSASVTAIKVYNDLQPVEGGIAYKADNEGTALRITSIVGINVFSANVSGEGFIALPKGLYVYTFGNRSGKIYIR